MLKDCLDVLLYIDRHPQPWGVNNVLLCKELTFY